MIKGEQNEPTILTLDVPQREGKDGYIGTIFSLYLRLGGIIADSSFKDSDPRVYLFTKFMIGLIPGEKNRDPITKKMEAEIELVEKKDINDEKKNRERNLICLKYIGSIHDFVDKHLGVSEENRIGIVAPPRYNTK